MAAQPRTIVVGFDGSEAALRALDTASGLVGYGSTLTVVAVATTADDDARARLTAARERLLGRHVQATYVERAGEPAAEILEAARSLEADLVVVGRREPPTPDSVSSELLRLAEMDVLVVA